MQTRNLNIVLLSLTGFGKPILQALVQDPYVNVVAVFTHQYENPYPYYPEENLIEMCVEMAISCHFDCKVSSEEGIELLKHYDPDLIIVATFREFLKTKVLSVPKRGIINMHPSLLPKYRGVCPTQAALLNGDTTTGISVHWLVEEMDAGNILLQREIPIDSEETDSTLRKKLAELAGEMIPDVIGLFEGEENPIGISQDESGVSLALRPTEEDGYLESCESVEELKRKVRALNPFPGTTILIGSKHIPVHRYKRLEGEEVDGIYSTEKHVDFWKDSSGVRLPLSENLQ